MQTFLIISKNKDREKIYINDMRKKQNIDPLDCVFLSTEKTFGIENVRDLQKTIFLKPLKSKEKIVVVEDFQTATIEAQNAMLKILEEPPNNTIIILTSQSIRFVIPTVLSRTTLVHLEDEEKNDRDSKSTEELLKIITMTDEEKLYLAQEKSKDKELAINWVVKLIYGSRNLLLENSSRQNIEMSKNLIESYRLITETNVNTRFLLENTLLKLRQIG